MTGTITVTGEPTDADPDAHADAAGPGRPSPTPPPAATPSPSREHAARAAGRHDARPRRAPVGAPGRPRVAGLRLKAIRHGARVTFKLSETAAVTLRFKRRGSSKVAAHARALAARRHAHGHGARRAARRGRYIVEIEARDAARQPRAVRRATLRIERPRMTPCATRFRPPADAWSRRDFMRNGMTRSRCCARSARPAPLGGERVPTSAARRAQASSPFAPFQRDLPIMPELAPVSTRNGVDVYDVDIREGLAEILPGLQTPIYGYDGHLSRPDDPRAQGPRRDRPRSATG